MLPHPALFSAAMTGIVTSLDDPLAQARVQVRLPALPGATEQWARVVCPFAGADRGAFWLPDVGDEVLLVFLQGDTSHPLVLGGLWHGSATPPAAVEAGGRNVVKRLRSANGIQITLEDRAGQEQLRLETPGGCSLTLQDGPGQITLQDGNGNRLLLDAAGVHVQAAAQVEVQAAQLRVSAGMVQVDAALSTFSGVVQCDTLITNAVVSASYTPGAGNIW